MSKEGIVLLEILLDNLTAHNSDVDHPAFEWTVYILTGLLPEIDLFFGHLSQSKGATKP